MTKTNTIFEKNPTKTFLIFFVLIFIMGIGFLEFSASKIFGLGKVVVYQSHPIYGYRPIPNQNISRDSGKTNIKINNLGLRANQDWLEKKPNQTRILFLGDSVTYGGSYIDNQDLFSNLVFKKNKNITNNKTIESGNAGVNGWGILNIHGLIKHLEFMPADIYITVVPEGDFYRGLNRIGGQPFWTRTPRMALEELLQHIIYVLSLKKNSELNILGLPLNEQQKTVELAVQGLKDYDLYLKQHGHKHYIFISPSVSQVLNQNKNDKLIYQALEKNKLNYIYIKNKIPDTLTQDQKSTLFHDNIHLSKAGHQLWADIIQKEIDLN
jgi:hypothetical protein